MGYYTQASAGKGRPEEETVGWRAPRRLPRAEGEQRLSRLRRCGVSAAPAGGRLWVSSYGLCFPRSPSPPPRSLFRGTCVSATSPSQRGALPLPGVQLPRVAPARDHVLRPPASLLVPFPHLPIHWEVGNPGSILTSVRDILSDLGGILFPVWASVSSCVRLALGGELDELGSLSASHSPQGSSRPPWGPVPLPAPLHPSLLPYPQCPFLS